MKSKSLKQYSLSILTAVGSVVFSVTAHADLNQLVSGPVFEKLCAGSVTQLTPSSFGYHRTQIVSDSQSLFFVERRFGSLQEWVIKKTSDGVQEAELAAYAPQVRDLLIVQNELWLLFDKKILILDSVSGKQLHEIATFPLPTEFQHERAHEMTLFNNQILVANGSLGVAVIDPVEKKLVQLLGLDLRKQANDHWSKAVGITSVGNQIYVAVDNVTLPTPEHKPFNGVIRISGNDFRNIAQFPINQQTSGIVASVISTQGLGNELILNNWGNLHRVPVSRLMTPNKSFSVNYKQYLSEWQGQEYSVELLGDVLFTSKNEFIACAKISPDDNVNKVAKRVGIVFRGQL